MITTAIMPEMEIYGSDNVRVGSVDAVDHARIRVNMTATAMGPTVDHDRFVLLADVGRVEGNRVHLTVPGAESVHPVQRREELDPAHTKLEPPASLKPR